MATYYNEDTDSIWLGTEFKMNVHMDPIGDYHMGDVDFQCSFFTSDESNAVVLTKDDMIEIDEDNYVAALDSTDLGKGTIVVKFEADIPDADFEVDGLRHEIEYIFTEMKIKSRR